mgnify:CR=1 FL=1
MVHLFGSINWVNYGWELFNYISEARRASLGNSTVAYNFDSPSSSLGNPCFPIKSTRKISLTHQSRFAGIVNSELASFQLKKNERLININLIFEGISNIPDTRSALLDWGYDGQYGTDDSGESNGIIDEGERLDINKIKFFSQRRLGFYLTSNFLFNQLPYGIGLKIISTSLGDQNGIGIGLDLGFYKKIMEYNLAIIIKNFPASGMMWSNGYIEGTGLSAEFGIHRSFDVFDGKAFELNTMSSLSVNTSNRSMSSFYSKGNISLDVLYGLELTYKKSIMLRLGQNFDTQLAGGIGIDWDKFIIDYAFLPSSLNGIFANHHLISLSIYLDWVLAKIKENKK